VVALSFDKAVTSVSFVSFPRDSDVATLNGRRSRRCVEYRRKFPLSG